MTKARDARRRLRLQVCGVACASVLVLAACVPETPDPPPPPPPAAQPAGAMCGWTADTDADGDARGYAATVDTGTGRKVVAFDAADRDEKVAKIRALEDKGNRIIDVEREVPVSIAAADGPANDPFYRSGASGGGTYGLWGVDRVDAPEAWGSPPLRQGQGVTVAVVDSGVQADHPALAGRVLPGVDYIAPAPYDGRVDGNGHGTHVAGIIAENDDASGGIGVAPQAMILPVRVLDCQGSGSSASVANGIYWAIDHGADVLNLSIGVVTENDTIRRAVERALAAGVVVVAAGGNSGASCTTPLTTTPTIPPTSAPTLPPPTAPSNPTTPIGTAAAPTTTTSLPTTPTTAVTSPSTAVTSPSTAVTSPTTVPTSPTTAVTSPTTVPTSTTTVPTPPVTEATPPSTTTPPAAAEGAPPGGSEPPGATAPVADAPVADLEAVVTAACPSTPYSNPLYPAGFAIGRPGLLAVAATGSVVSVSLPVVTPGLLTWSKRVGDYVEKGQELARVGGSQGITSPVAGVLTAQTIAAGTVVSTGQQFARMLSADHRAAYSNVNPYITIAAPGGATPSVDFGIWSTLPSGGYGYKSGTSMAAPHVAAVAALVLGKCPSLTPAQVAQRLTSTADDVGPAGWDPAFGFGVVQADGAVAPGC